MDLREQRNKIHEQMKDMLAATAEHGMSLDDQEKYAALESEFNRLTNDIEARERAAAMEARLEQPQPVPAGVVKAATVKVYEDDNRLYRQAFNKYLRGGLANLSERDRNILESRAQSVGTPSEGGYLVPEEFRQKLVDVRKAFGGLASVAEEIITASGAPIEYPTIDDTANKGAIKAEAGEFTGGADLVFGSVSLGAYKFTSAGGSDSPLRVSYELLQDAAFDIEDLIARKLGERIARAEADKFVNGSGVGEPEGIAGSSITEDLDVDTHDTLDYDDLLDMEGRLDPAYEANARWIMSKKTWNVVRGIIDQNSGRPIVMAAAEAGIGTAPEKMLLGYPVVIEQAMPDFPGAGDEHFIALGDWREAFVIRRVSGLAVVVNPYSRANFGQVEFTAWERVDSAVQNRKAYVLMANTAS